MYTAQSEPFTINGVACVVEVWFSTVIPGTAGITITRNDDPTQAHTWTHESKSYGTADKTARHAVIMDWAKWHGAAPGGVRGSHYTGPTSRTSGHFIGALSPGNVAIIALHLLTL